MINKSTFYQHYQTIDMLHDEICKRAVAEVLLEIEGIDNIFENTGKLVQNAMTVFATNREKLRALFFDNIIQFSICVEDEFIKLSIHPEFTKEEKDKIRFVVGGATRILSFSNDEETIKNVIKMVDKQLNG